MVPNVSERLEQTFSAWQLHTLMYETEMMSLEEEGQITRQQLANSRFGTKLANTILDKSIPSINDDSWSADLDLLENNQFLPVLLKGYTSFPRELFNWNRKSRRVFHIPASLQAVLASANFPKMKWEEVTWPYDSFIVSVENPIMVSEGATRFDAVLITREPRDKGFNLRFRWLDRPPKEGIKTGLSKSERTKFIRLTRAKKTLEAKALVTKKLKSRNKDIRACVGGTNLDFDVKDESELILTEARDLYDALYKDRSNRPKSDETTPEQFTEHLSVTLRIVLGWMFYLETLSADSITWSKPLQRSHRSIGESGVITSPEEICEIIGKGTISAIEVTDNPERRNHKGFVRPHWRMAHWRRPAGSDPSAEKTVKVPAQLIRADLVPLYGIVAGTTSIAIVQE